MELRHIRYFVRAAELMHFTRAAESLYVSQPTLSTHIQQLEEELGEPLFDRVGRNVQLTAAGQLFLKYGQSALESLDVAKEKITALKDLVSGTVRVGALLTFGYEILPKWIGSFHASHPQLRIDIQTGPSDQIESEILSGGIDLGLAFVPPVSDDIHGEVLLVDRVYLVVSEAHALARRKQISVGEMADLPLAMVTRRWAARRIYDSFLADNQVAPNILVESDDLHVLLKLATTGDVAVMMPRVAVGKNPALRLIPIEDSPKVEYGILWHAHGYLSPAAQAFLSHIRSEA